MRRFDAERASQGRRAARVARDQARTRYAQIQAESGGKCRQNVPAHMVPAYVAAVDGTATPRQAIKAMCSECCGFDREAVAACPARYCPLWKLRPSARTFDTADAGSRCQGRCADDLDPPGRRTRHPAGGVT